MYIVEPFWNAEYYREIQKPPTTKKKIKMDKMEQDLRNQFEEFITYFKTGNTTTFEFSIEEDKNRKNKSYCYKFSAQE
jgi:hypothetical protein